MLETLNGILSQMGVNQEITRETTLDGLGIDSLAILELVVSIEEHFGIVFEDDDMISENFQSVGSIMKLLDRYVA